MYEERNNKRQTNQVLLSVLAVAILVVAVVGVSFAFFTYSRQGTTTNTINTGSLVFKYEEEGPGITITNAIPTDDPTSGSDASNNFDFKVVSTISGNMNINYEISVRDVTTTDSGKTEREHLDPKYVKVALYKSDDPATFTSDPVIKEYFSKLTAATNNEGAKHLADGTFTGSASDTVQKTHNYRFKMWFAKMDADNKETMMTPDMCTNEDYEGGLEKIPCDDPVYGEEGSNPDHKGSYAEEDKGTNGKTFAVKLDVTAKDATA